MSWNVGSNAVNVPSVSLRHCSTPTRSRQYAVPSAVKWRSGSVAMNPLSAILVGIDICAS